MKKEKSNYELFDEDMKRHYEHVDEFNDEPNCHEFGWTDGPARPRITKKEEFAIIALVVGVIGIAAYTIISSFLK